MSHLFEELDYSNTPLGELVLRRRRILKLDRDVVEVVLNDEHLMSDYFTVSEVALANIPMALLAADAPDILVGGLGLGYTADAVLGYDHVRSLTVIDYLAPVIRWHHQGILPLGKRLSDDPRCTLVEGDFFALARGGAELGALALDRGLLPQGSRIALPKQHLISPPAQQKQPMLA